MYEEMEIDIKSGENLINFRVTTPFLESSFCSLSHPLQQLFYSDKKTTEDFYIWNIHCADLDFA